MERFEQLVKALRCCDKYALCNDCPIFETCDGDVDKAMAIAADAIEELQQIADHYEQTAKDYWKEACEYKAQLPKRGEWVKNEGRCGWHCSCCKVDNNFAYSWNSETGENEFQDNYCPNCGAKMEVQE